MSDATLNPEVEATPDQGRHTTPDERLAALSREAVEDFEQAGGELEEATEPLQAADLEIEVEVDDATDEVEVENTEDDTEADAEDHVDTEALESQDASEQDADTSDSSDDGVPDDLRADYESKMARVEKGLQKRLQQLSDKEKQLDTLILQNQQMQQQQTVQQPAQQGPPKAPEAGATQAQWAEFDQANTQYYTQKAISDLQNSGQLADPRQVQQMQEQQAMQNRLYLITSQEGASDEILLKMRDMAAGDDKYLDMYNTDKGAVAFFNEAKLTVERDKLASDRAEFDKQTAEAATATAKRKAGAAGRATPRPGGSKAASSQEDTFAKKTFRNVDDKLAYLNQQTLNEAGVS